MKKRIVSLVGGLMLFAAGTAGADHRLLVTDVLDPGKLDAAIAWEWARSAEESFTGSAIGFSVGAGVAKNLEVSVSAPYVLFNKLKWFSTDSGWGDLTVAAKYKILDENPFTLTAGLGVTLDTGSSRFSSGDTEYSPLIAISKDLGHETKPYFAYKPVLRGEDQLDTHTIRIGIEKELNHLVTFDGSFDMAFYSGGGAHDLREYTLDLATYLQLAKNFYLIPSAGFSYITVESEDATAWTLGTALYYMF